MKPPLKRLKNLRLDTKDHFKNLHAQTKFIKPLHIFLEPFIIILDLTGKLRGDPSSTRDADRPF